MKKILLLSLLLLSCDMILLFQSPDSRFTGEWEYNFQGSGEYYTISSYEFNDTNKCIYYYSINHYTYIYYPESYVKYYYWKISDDSIIFTEEYSGTQQEYKFYFSGSSLFLKSVTYDSEYFIEYKKL